MPTTNLFRGLLLVALFLAGPVARGEDAPRTEMPWIDPAGIRGSILLCGGKEVPESVQQRFVQLAGKEKARIVVVGFGKTDGDDIAAWNTLGAEMESLSATSHAEASQDAFSQPLKDATAVWIIGDAAQLQRIYADTPVQKELAALLARGGVIGAAGSAVAEIGRFKLLPGVNFADDKLSGNWKLALDDGAALLVRGRQMQVLGSGNVTITLAASASRPEREIVLKEGAIHDLTTIRRAALARSLPAFPAKQLAPARLGSGSLVIVGGGGMPKEVEEKFIALAGGPTAPIVVLPTANPTNGQPESGAGEFFKRAGAKDVTVLPQRTRDEVESPEFAAALKRAKGVWFGGGRQWRFVDAYAQTKALRLFYDVLARGGVIGGSSAGASIQAEYLVRGSPLGNTEMMCEGYERGLGFLPGVAIDQHFAQRKRFADMTSVMRTFPQLLGIGIDEATALVVQGQTATVIGRGNAQFYDYRHGPPQGEKDYIVVKPGERFDLVERKVLPEPTPQ
jgi:cyanophycinase